MHPQYTPEQIQRFWNRVDKSGGPAACWPWLACRDARGYGKLGINYVTLRAHQVAYTLTHGEIPAGQVVRHSCDNPTCANPAHLLLGTQKDNLQDMTERGRRRNIGSPGERNPTAKLNAEQVRAIRERLARGARPCDLAKEYGVWDTNIAKIAARKTWKHVA